MRKPQDVKKVFLLFFEKQINNDEPATTYVQGYTLLELWSAFKALAYTPFQAIHQGFIFEAFHSPSTQGDQKQYVIFRRYFFSSF